MLKISSFVTRPHIATPTYIKYEEYYERQTTVFRYVTPRN
jgi:hypothetical protein